MVYQLRNAIRRNDTPKPFPSGVTCWRRHRDWTAAGVWPKVCKLVLAELAATGMLDTSELFFDATFGESRKGGNARAERAAASA
jgi:hypothetical protein